MQSESLEKCSFDNYQLESLKVIHSTVKDHYQFFQFPAYSQQMNNVKTFLWVSNLILTAIFGSIFFLYDKSILNTQNNFILLGFFVSAIPSIICVVLCVLCMRQQSQFLAKRYTDYLDTYVTNMDRYFYNHLEAYQKLLIEQIKGYERCKTLMRNDFDNRGKILIKIRQLLVFSFLTFVFSLTYFTYIGMIK